MGPSCARELVGANRRFDCLLTERKRNRSPSGKGFPSAMTSAENPIPVSKTRDKLAREKPRSGKGGCDATWEGKVWR